MTDERWLSDYVLGEGSETDRAVWQRRLDADPQLHDRARRLGDVVDRLQALPAGTWEQISDQDAAKEQTDTAVTRRPGRHRWTLPATRRSFAAAALIAVFAVGVGVGAVLRGGRSSTVSAHEVASTVRLRPLSGTPPTASGIARLLNGGRLQLSVSDLPATTTGHYYEAWLMSSTTRLIPLASFRVARRGHAHLTLQLPAAASSYRYIDVSLQNAAAGPAHSHRSVLRGPTR